MVVSIFVFYVRSRHDGLFLLRTYCCSFQAADKCGLIVPHDDTRALANALAQLATNEPLRRKFQAQALATIKDWNADVYMGAVLGAGSAGWSSVYRALGN